MAQFTIQATAKGTILPFVLKPQESVVVRWVGGYWTCNPTVQPSQYDGNGNANYIAQNGYLLSYAYEGRLIACVGNPSVQKFSIGNYGVVHGYAGQLWVACNDDWDGVFGAGYSDNRGAIIVEVDYVNSFIQGLKTDQEIAQFLAATQAQASEAVLAEAQASIGAVRNRLYTGSNQIVQPRDAAFVPEETAASVQ